MTAGLKHQIEYALSASRRNAQALETMLEVYGKLEPEGWTPKIYHQCIKELYRVHMCVVHRSLISDIQLMADQINADDLPEHRTYYNTGNDIAVPVAAVESLARPGDPRDFDKVNLDMPIAELLSIPNTKASWETLLANVIAPAKYTPCPEYPGARRKKVPA